jgi:hypothetical protein
MGKVWGVNDSRERPAQMLRVLERPTPETTKSGHVRVELVDLDHSNGHTDLSNMSKSVVEPVAVGTDEPLFPCWKGEGL